MDTLDLSDMLRACPAHLDLSNNYLGDGGAAAFVRVLTMLRWVKSVDLRGVGAGARTIRALCDLLAVETPVAAGKAYTTTHDVDGSSTVVLPCVGLTHVDLRQNDVFAMSARKLLTALRHRRHRLAIFLATTPHVAVPTMEVELDWDELPPTTADALRELNAQGADQHERVAAATEREKAEERLRIFCSTDDAQQPLGQHVMYRIPERLPTTAQDDGGDGATTTTTTSSSPSAPSYFYDVDDPSMVRLVRDMNNHMESYLAAYRCFTAMDEDDENDAPRTSSSSSRTFGNRAAAQVCVELGADTLNFLGHTNAAVWYACADRTSVLDDARFGPLMLREHPSITRTRYRRKMEVLANIHALLRGFYANPFLEEEVMAQRGAILGGYLRTLKEKYYESSAREKMMREEVCSRLRELDAELAEMDAETAEVEVGYDGSRAMRERRATLMSTATDLRRRMKEVSAGALVVDEEEEQRLEVMASLYHRIVSALVSRRMDDLPSMKHFEHRLRVLRTWMIAELFDGTSVEDLEARQRRLRAEAMYLVLPSQRYAAPLGRGEFRTNNNNNTYNNTPSSVAGEAISSPCTASTSPYRRVLPLWCAKMKYVLLNAPEEVSTWNSHYAGKATPSPFRIDSHAPLKSNTNNNTKMMMDEPHEAATTTTTPGAACTCQHQHDVRPHAHPRPNGEPPFLYHPLPRPCASCCHAAIANLPEMLRDVHLHARLDATSQMREALPMEVKLFLLDMMVRRRSSSSYIPCMFSSVDGTQLEVVQTCEANTYKKTTTQEGANDDDNDEDEDASSSSSSSCISATGGHAYPHTSLHPTSPLLSVLDVLACVDGRRKQLVRVVSAFEEWYRLRMVESFDVSDPHFVPRPSAFMCGGAEDDDADEDGVGGTHDVDAHRNEEEVVAVQS